MEQTRDPRTIWSTDISTRDPRKPIRERKTCSADGAGKLEKLTQNNEIRPVPQHSEKSTQNGSKT